MPVKAIAKPAMNSTMLGLMTDSMLDDAFAAEFDKGIQYRYSLYYSSMLGEIVGRIASVSGFVFGFVTGSRFPKYEARIDSKFNQGDAARTAVKDSAMAVADSVGGFMKTGTLIAAVVLAGIIYLKVKK